MSEILIINTEKQELTGKLQTLDVYNEYFPMLDEVMPEYNGNLPDINVTEFVKRMILTMQRISAIGLSANQCGIRARIFVIGTKEFQMECINPKVLSASEEVETKLEGCCSFPAVYVKVPRPVWIDVEYTTLMGDVKQQRLEGLTARCFLHELDHLNGIKFTKYVKPVAMAMARKKAQKLWKKYKNRVKNQEK